MTLAPPVGPPHGRGGPGPLRTPPMARRSADPDNYTSPKSPSTGLRRSDRFLIGLHPFDRVVFVSHVQPDPDSLGSMLGLAHLVETRFGLPTRLSRDGLINRAENRAMVDL